MPKFVIPIFLPYYCDVLKNKIMKYYKFIGDEEEALYYQGLAGNEPKKGKIYRGDSLDFTNYDTTVKSWARDFPEDWEEVTHLSYVLQNMSTSNKYIDKYRLELAISDIETELKAIKK